MAKKRGNGEGSAPYKRKDGRWCARHTAYTPAGPKRKPVYGRTRAEAAEKLAKALADREGSRFTFDARNLTVGGYLARWLEDNVQGSVKPITYESYERLVRVHIAPALGHLKLKALTPPHVRGLYRSKLEAGLAPRTVQYIHAVLNRALKVAVNDGLIPRNSCKDVGSPKVQREEMQYPNPRRGSGVLRGGQRGSLGGPLRPRRHHRTQAGRAPGPQVGGRRFRREEDLGAAHLVRC